LAGRGLVGNADQGGRRQLTVIEQEAWKRANLMVSGVRLAESRDRVLRVGACRLRIGGETRPGKRTDEALPGLRSATRVDWGGVFGEVWGDGEIAVGDVVEWEE
jgi:MOSC domain-containing protein YiiM